MQRYMYIDESGDLGERGSKFLVLSCLLVDDPRKLDRIIKNMRRNKFRKPLKDAPEIKANKSSGALRKYMLLKLNEVKSAEIFFIVLEKRKIVSNYLKSNKNRLYNYVAGKLAREIILDNVNVEVRIDRSKGKQLLRDDFDVYFLDKLTKGSNIRKIDIHHSYSHNWAGLQFADMIAWACFQKFEHDISDFIDLITLDLEVFYVW
ncbi:DUF3800 domain-containing protein [bacterium]|nr:DUF3800 domain-containing protein [bacterium]